jgi:hypothetical protein
MRTATVGNLALDYLSPGAIYALASRKYRAEIVEQVLAGRPRAAGLQVPLPTSAGTHKVRSDFTFKVGE